MKNTIRKNAVASVLAFSLTAGTSSAVTLAVNTTPTALENGITYTVTGGGSNSTLSTIQKNSNDGETIVFDFQGGLVDFTVGYAPGGTGTGNPLVHSNHSTANNTFSADAGSWSFVPGAVIIDGGTSGWYTFTGSDVVATGVGVDPATGLAPSYTADWGSFTIQGVSSVTWTSVNNVTERFVFDAVESTIPEPSSIALLGLGGLALVVRRKR